jgi:Fic family protein
VEWAKITKCSSDSALRDMKALVQLGVLKQEPAGGRSTSYAVDLELFPTKENEPK